MQSLIAVFEGGTWFCGQRVSCGGWSLESPYTICGQPPIISCLFHCSSILPRHPESRLALTEQSFLSPHLPSLFPCLEPFHSVPLCMG